MGSINSCFSGCEKVIYVSVHEECLRICSGTVYRRNENPHCITFLMDTLQFLYFNAKTIKQFSSNTSYFIVCEAICFGPYMIIIRLS